MEQESKTTVSEKAKRILARLNGSPFGPYIIEIHPTYRCNLHCIFCKQEVQRRDGSLLKGVELSTGKLLEIVDEAANMNVEEVRLCGGGEPFFHPERAIKIIKRIKEKGMKGSITTNGTMINDIISRELVNLGWEIIEISIDGATAETHDPLRGVNGSFHKAIGAVRSISQWKQYYNSSVPNITINTVVTSKNYTELPKMAELFSNIGAERIILLNLHPGGEEWENLKLDDKDKQKLGVVVKTAVTAGRKCNIEIFTDMVEHSNSDDLRKGITHIPRGQRTQEQQPQNNPGIFSVACYEPWYYLQVLPDGRVSPCCNSYSNDDGESLHSLSLGEMWLNGSHLTKVRKDILMGELNGVCRECDAVRTIRANLIRDALYKLITNKGE